MIWESDTLDETQNIAKNIVHLTYPQQRFYTFSGPLGSGKTTLIRFICGELGIKDKITSPTFTLMNIYLKKFSPVYHFDFFRIRDITEVYDLGYEEFFYGGETCFVEWPEKIYGLLPENTVQVAISPTPENTRKISISLTKSV